ncbi:fatty acid desaturase [Staphylococcus epidermidis]|uniref:fatty acid desaturase family protein n=1 Tax=Staphylococcus epidermidis TaxID=1282 RepID=UPI00073C8B2C|nr:fatty acid desaturase family protein [Staphylococcus epidermidis]KSZ63630.1 fatty acid desaturase [Staphylococcus epidermidis]KSZ64415.1 fatty acid desaturase [Staphylococcus epidermidis]KSZ66503.1 fatty acid desaturase [Staphylococcus epidermidis]KSZ67590.1 fatty acid desaturase [Staphylococcus epidermidis]MCG1416642.1 fatty acid desaturase family protein [Staphylococcus epidermidis]
MFSKEIRKELKPLIKKNNYNNVIALLFDWFVIFSSILISVTFNNILIYLVAIILIGSRMRAFDNLMHEACHRFLFTNKFWNKWIACLFVAFSVFTSYTAYCNSHFQHHRNLWDEENDPDTKRYRLVGLDKPQKSTKMFVKNHIVKVLLLFHVPKYIVGTVSANLYTKEVPKSEIWVKNIFWIAIITSSVIFNFWLYLILYWLIPILTTFQIIRYWAEMAEHSGLNNKSELTASRNTFGMPWTIFIFHPHHDNYHLVHHLFPAIPHYNLKKAHEILMKDTAYRNAHHCTGFFKTTLPGFYSVVKDICTPNYERKES